MAVAPRPWQTPALPVRPRKRQVVRRRPKSATITPAPPLRVAPPVKNIPAHSSNFQLKLLAMGQRLTQFLAIASVTTAVGLYACTVYNQNVWSDSYAKLDRLQDDERSFVTNNESLKQQYIDQAESEGTDLVTPKPEHNVFVPAPKSVKLRPQPEPTLQPIDNQTPIGY